MSLEESLRASARSVSGDESILDVAELHPRGFTAAAGAAAGAGSALGGSATSSTLGSMAGTAGGAAAGMAGAAAARGLPIRICVAVSPESIHLLEIRNKIRYDDLALITTLNRAETDVEVLGRVFNRVVVLEDRETGKKYEMEAPRVGPFKTKDLVKLLQADGDGQVVEETGVADTEGAGE